MSVCERWGHTKEEKKVKIFKQLSATQMWIYPWNKLSCTWTLGTRLHKFLLTLGGIEQQVT